MVAVDVTLVCDACGTRQSHMIAEADLAKTSAEGLPLLCIKCQAETRWRASTGPVRESAIKADPLLELSSEPAPAPAAPAALDPLLVTSAAEQGKPPDSKRPAVEWDWFG